MTFQKFVDQKWRDLLNIAAVNPYRAGLGSVANAAHEVKKLPA
jgi:hypothetical protein